MKILILGSSGRTGKCLLNYTIEKGHEVNCLVRDPTAIKETPEVKIFEGTPTDKDILREAMNGCAGLLSTLNISRKSDFPWSGLRTPKTFLSDVMKNILELAPSTGLKRVVICTAWGTAETKGDLPFWFRWMIDKSNIKTVYRDHERQEKLLSESDLDWTIVRPSGLTNSKNPGVVKVSYNNEPKPSLMISRQMTARFMVDSLEDPAYYRKMPVISSA